MFPSVVGPLLTGVVVVGVLVPPTIIIVDAHTTALFVSV